MQSAVHHGHVHTNSPTQSSNLLTWKSQGRGTGDDLLIRTAPTRGDLSLRTAVWAVKNTSTEQMNMYPWFQKPKPNVLPIADRGTGNFHLL